LELLKDLRDVRLIDDMLGKKDITDGKGRPTGEKVDVAAALTGDKDLAIEVAQDLIALRTDGIKPEAIDVLVKKLISHREEDNLLNRGFELAGQVFRVNKADVGGDPGHTTPPWVTLPAFRATLREMQENGLIKDWRALSIGDDGHHVTVDNKPLDSS